MNGVHASHVEFWFLNSEEENKTAEDLKIMHLCVDIPPPSPRNTYTHKHTHIPTTLDMIERRKLLRLFRHVPSEVCLNSDKIMIHYQLVNESPISTNGSSVKYVGLTALILPGSVSLSIPFHAYKCCA